MADNEQQPSDDLRSLLAGAIEESASNASAAVADAKPAPKVDADTDAGADKGAAKASEAEPKSDDDRPRGEDGKFVKKSDDDKKAEGAADDKKADAQEDEPKVDAKADADKDAKAEPKTGDGKEPPAHWPASDKAMFKLQSPEAQEFLLRRHKQMEADYTKKLEPLTDLKKEYEPVQQLFAPHLEVLKHKGLTPQTVIKRWADVETGLATPGRNVDVVDNIIKAYNVDRAALAKRLGFTSSPSGQQSTDAAGGAADHSGRAAGDISPQSFQMPPELAEELRQLREGFNAFKQADTNAKIAASQAAEQKVETEISNFKSAVNDKGELLHPYFEEVESSMIVLAQSYVARKQQPPPLAELYDMAVYANPSTRQALLAVQRTAQEAKAAEEARAKAASARKAASSVTGAPGTGQASKPIRGELSLREAIEEAAAESAA